MVILAKKKIHPASHEEQFSQVNSLKDTEIEKNLKNETISNLNHKLDKKINEDNFDSNVQNLCAKNFMQSFFMKNFNKLTSCFKWPINKHKKIDLSQTPYRKNGWSQPFHLLQITAFFAYFFITGVLFFYFMPKIKFENNNLVTLIYAFSIILFFVHTILHLSILSINPADDNVIAKQRKLINQPLPVFDRTKHKHVIENQFCYICECQVSARSKHCSACNKCIFEFDHHCSYLNCVGSKNYRLFISSVISALLGSSLLLILSIIFLMCYFDTKCILAENLYISNSFDKKNFKDIQFQNYTNVERTTFSSITNDNITNLNENLTSIADFSLKSNFENLFHHKNLLHFIILVLSFFISLVIVILLFYLLCFHIFLNFIGLSTYEFIVERRESKNFNENKLQSQSSCRRIYETLFCQNIFSKVLSKSQNNLKENQIDNKNINSHLNLINKRQLTQQMSNDSQLSRLSRLSKLSKESSHCSNHTISFYEEYVLDKNNEISLNNKLNLPETDSSVYLGSPQKRVLEEWKTLNTISTNDENMNKDSKVNIKNEKINDEKINFENDVKNLITKNYASIENNLENNKSENNNLENKSLENKKLEKNNLENSENNLKTLNVDNLMTKML